MGIGAPSTDGFAGAIADVIDAGTPKRVEEGARMATDDNVGDAYRHLTAQEGGGMTSPPRYLALPES